MDKLQEAIRSLQAMLDDRHEGLSTWRCMFMDICDKVHDALPPRSNRNSVENSPLDLSKLTKKDWDRAKELGLMDV